MKDKLQLHPFNAFPRPLEAPPGTEHWWDACTHSAQEYWLDMFCSLTTLNMQVDLTQNVRRLRADGAVTVMADVIWRVSGVTWMRVGFRPNNPSPVYPFSALLDNNLKDTTTIERRTLYSLSQVIKAVVEEQDKIERLIKQGVKGND